VRKQKFGNGVIVVTIIMETGKPNPFQSSEMGMKSAKKASFLNKKFIFMLTWGERLGDFDFLVFPHGMASC